MHPSPKRTLPEGIYAITAETHSAGRSNIDVAQAICAGGATTLQYREKRPYKNQRQMVAECRRIRSITRDHGVLFIVNDHIDIALLCDADGVHVGQDDLAVADVRTLVGADKLIGVSTHSPDQARTAVREGADYIGVGPLFATQTKEDVCAAVGLEYLEFAVAHIDIPLVAIGGIKSHNIDRVVRRGARTICLVTEIVGADDIVRRVQHLNTRLNGSSAAPPGQ